MSLLLLALLACGAGLHGIRPVPPPLATAPPPPVPEARRAYLEARLLLLGGDSAAAATAFARARRFDPDSPWIALAQGDAALAGADMLGAEAFWRQAVDLDPACGPAWLRLARVLRVHGDPDEAVAAYDAALTSGEGGLVHAELVELLRQEGREEEARQRVAAWVEAEQDLPRRERRARAEARLAVGDHLGAWEDLSLYVEVQPEDVEAIDLLVLLAGETGRLRSTLGLLDRAVVALPADVEVAHRLVAYLEGVGHHARVVPALRHLQQLLPEEDPGLVADEVRALLLLERKAEALQALDHLARLAPDWPGLEAMRAQAQQPHALGLSLEEAPADRVDRLRIALAREPQDPRLRALLAAALVEAGLHGEGPEDTSRLAEGRAIARAGLAAEPRSAQLLNVLAWSFAATGQDLDEAIVLARRGLELSPADPHLLDTLGWALWQKGDAAEARALLREARSLAPHSAEIAGHLGELGEAVLPAPPAPSESP